MNISMNWSTMFAATLTVALVACGEEDLGEIENTPPVANAGINQDANVGDRVLFDGSGSTDDGEIVDFEWDFGDGIIAAGVSADHIYTEAGEYTVSLKVTDDLGATDVDVIRVTIGDNASPIAVIDAPLTARVGENVRFDGSASSDPDGTISSFTWDLGDGSELFGPQVDHAFTVAGTFLVTLEVMDDQGATAIGEHEITIEEAPASFSGTWNWFLVDESQRDLGFPCGTFQDSTLTIEADNPPSITITEGAGGITVDYAGTLTAEGHFETMSSSFGTTQTIIGDFTSATTFDGTYGMDPGFGEPCPDRAVTGVKVSD
jgi:PKD repeat protein